MMTTVWGVVQDGKVELPDGLRLGNGTRVLVTALPADDDTQFWQNVSQSSLDAIWDNPQDDIYGELLKK